MDTLSRDSSSSSSSIVPMAGLFAAVLALILAIVALVKLSTVQKAVTTQGEEVAKITSIEAEVRNASSAAAKASTEIQNLGTNVQSVLNQVANEMSGIKTSVAKIEEAQKARVAAPGPGKGGKAAPAPTGVRNADGTYTVAAGDTPSNIARKFGISLDALLAENPGLEPSRLRVGQKLRLPTR